MPRRILLQRRRSERGMCGALPDAAELRAHHPAPLGPTLTPSIAAVEPKEETHDDAAVQHSSRCRQKQTPAGYTLHEVQCSASTGAASSQRVLARARAVLVEHKGRVTVRRWPHRSSSYSEMLGHRRLGKSAEAGHARPAGCQRASMQRCASDRADGRHGKGYAMALRQRAPAVRIPPREV
jgi:hypothetical protein